MDSMSFRSKRWSFAILIGLVLSLLFPLPSAAQTSPISCASGYALWANGQGRDDVFALSGSTNTVSGAVHSNADLRISGSSNRISGAVEYVTIFQDSGDSNIYPSPARATVAQPPIAYALADYRPGGAAATAAQAAGRYRAITGDLDISDSTVLDGLYYVTGNAKLSASNLRGTFTIVAEGTIDVSGSSLQATPYAGGLLLFAGKREVGASVIKIAGSGSDLRGVIYGPGGTVELSGSNSSISGIVLGDALKLNGSSLSISFAGAYCPGATAPPAEEPRPVEPPARIIITDDDITERVEVINAVTFITIQFTIRNTGGHANNTRLVINLGRDDDDDDDDRFELVDVRFAEGTGFVRERDGRRVVIGIGLNNRVQRANPVVVSVTYRLRDSVRDDDDDGRITFAARAQLRFSDSDGSEVITIPILLVPVAIIVQPPRAPEVVRLPLDRIDVRLRGTWERLGGLPIFGLPLTEARIRADGTVVQVFERARLELRPSGVVLFGRLAAELGYGMPPSSRGDDLDDDDRRWYRPETGHVIGAPFRNLWARPIGLLIFGLPITPILTDDDGRETQCFERVCMQVFVELRGTQSEIQLRLLGVELITRGDDDDD
jgi:hypothetical protein